MGEKRSETPAVMPRSDSDSSPGRITIDINNHLAQRSAVSRLLNRQKPGLFVTSRTHHRGKFTALVLIDSRYFDVDRRELGKLQAGASPGDLGIADINPDDYDED